MTRSVWTVELHHGREPTRSGRWRSSMAGARYPEERTFICRSPTV